MKHYFFSLHKITSLQLSCHRFMNINKFITEIQIRRRKSCWFQHEIKLLQDAIYYWIEFELNSLGCLKYRDKFNKIFCKSDITQKIDKDVKERIWNKRLEVNTRTVIQVLNKNISGYLLTIAKFKKSSKIIIKFSSWFFESKLKYVIEN